MKEEILHEGKWIDAEYTGNYFNTYHNEGKFEYRILKTGKLVWKEERGGEIRQKKEDK